MISKNEVYEAHWAATERLGVARGEFAKALLAVLAMSVGTDPQAAEKFKALHAAEEDLIAAALAVGGVGRSFRFTVADYHARLRNYRDTVGLLREATGRFEEIQHGGPPPFEP
jgi:hypothetical protein